MQRKLKIALLFSDWNIPAWQYDLLQEVQSSDYASFCTLIRVTEKSNEAFRRGLTCSLFEAFQRYDRKRSIEHDACEIINAEKLLSDIDCIALPLESDSGNARQQASQIARIKSQEIDVIFALDDIASIDMLLEASKYGVWFYDYSYGHSGPVDSRWIGFWEFLKQRPFLRSALMIRSTSCHEDKAACISYSGVDPRSHAITRNEHLWKIRAFVPRILWQLYAGNGENLISQADASLSSNNPGRPNILLSFSAYVLHRLALKLSQKFFSEKWILMFRLGGDPRKLDKYTKLHPPEDWFWADPYVLREDEYYYVFFEEASVETGHGHISVIRMDDSGDYSQPIRVLERPYHLSYPFIFEWQQNKYMIVETADNRTIEVYRCTDFPDDWEFHSTLMENISAYDVTLFDYNDTWWLFANIREHEGASTWDELCLFSSDNPLGNDWQPHPMNPIVSDVRSARPAGRIFQKDGRIYRPSQNSSFKYGYALSFNEILELTESTYKERLVKSFEPNWDRSIQALHTFSAAGDLAFIDAIHRTGKYQIL
jgi:hypothetical protein